MIANNGLAKQGSIKHGATSRLTFLGPSKRPKDPQGPQRPKAMQRIHTLHKPMRHFSPRFRRTTPWRWQILQRLHKPTEHRSRFSGGRYWSYRAKSFTSPQNLKHHKPRTPGENNRDIVQPRPSTDIGRPEIWPRHIQPQAKIEMCTPIADRN